MNYTPNQLQQWVDFYKANMPSKSNNEFDPAAGDNYLGRALSFGQQQMNGSPGAPDFFGGSQQFQPRPFVPAERFQGQQPPMQTFPNPMGPQVNNYLMRFLGR